MYEHKILINLKKQMLFVVVAGSVAWTVGLCVRSLSEVYQFYDHIQWHNLDTVLYEYYDMKMMHCNTIFTTNVLNK